MDHKKNSDIEVLRAAAILFTLVHHLPTLLNWQIGALNQIGRYFGFWGGVDLFFVVSGYVITRSLTSLRQSIADNGEWRRELKAFYTRRIFRLLPSAWLWLLIPCIYSLLASAPNIFPHIDTIRNDALAAAFNVADFYWPHCIASAQVGALCSPQMTLGHYWSLSLEEQFYAIFPLLLLCLRGRRVPLFLIAAIVLQFFWSRPPLTLGWYTRTDGLLWGVLLALLSTQPVYGRLEPKFAARPMPALVLFALSMLGIGAAQAFLAKFTFGPLGEPHRFAIGALAVCCAVAVYIASFDKHYLFPASRIKNCLVAIGARSYSLYLVHVPSFALAREISFHIGIETSAGRWGLLATGLLLSFISAELTYRFVEMPTRDFGRNLAQRLVARTNQPGSLAL